LSCSWFKTKQSTMTFDKLSVSGVKVTVTDKVVQDKNKRRTVRFG